MAYNDAIRDLFLIIHENIDSLLNYFDLDFIKEFTQNELTEPNNLINLNNNSPIFVNYIIPFYIQLSKIFYFYYPLIKSIPEFIIEFSKGNWIINFTNLPVSINHSINSILNEDIFFKTQHTNTLNLLKIPSYLDNKFYIGFLNSLFISFPFFSTNQIICFYRFLFNGPVIGITSILGWITGQCLLFCCVLFGLKSFIIQWFSLEPLTYFLSIYLVSTYIYKKLTVKTKARRGRKIKKGREKRKLKKKKKTKNVKEKKFWKTWKKKKTLGLERIFAFHLLLSWGEGGYLFPYLTNINFGLNTSIFDISITNSINDYILLHSSYILGIVTGCLFYSFLYYELFLRTLLIFIPIYKQKNKFNINMKKLEKRFRKKIKITILAFLMFLTMSSLSYYDIRYLLTSSFGFFPQDKLLSDILLNSSSDDPSEMGFGSMKEFLLEDDNDFMYIDILQMDNQEYKNTLEFEEINYAAEYAWISRLDKLAGPEKEVEVMNNNSLRSINKNVFNENINTQPSKVLKYKDKLDFNLSLITNRFITDNYLNLNNWHNLVFQENMNAFFKTDFIPYNKYFFVESYEDTIELEVDGEIKEKYYINPIYKTLLNLEIDAFLSRNSSEHLLLEFEENDLYNKRIALSNYLESNFYYSKMNKFDNFRNFFFNSKSFLNNCYNQQFKGTLRIVDQLFQITIDDNYGNRSLLKYDAPLFYKHNNNSIFHEELIEPQNILAPNYKGLLINSSSPLFIRWNNDLHQLTLTNNFFFINPYYSNNDFYKVLNNYNSSTISNLQKLNNISRDSYSLVQLPSIREMLFSGYYLDSIYDQPKRDYDVYISRVARRPLPTFDGINWENTINWYSFRLIDPVKRAQKKVDQYIAEDERDSLRKLVIQEESKEK